MDDRDRLDSDRLAADLLLGYVVVVLAYASSILFGPASTLGALDRSHRTAYTRAMGTRDVASTGSACRRCVLAKHAEVSMKKISKL